MQRNLVLIVLFLSIFPFAILNAQQAARQDTLKELMRRIDILTEELEKSKLGEVAETKYESRFGMGPAASRVYQLTQPGVSIAGYGEIVYNNFSTETDGGRPSGAADRIDYLRHIMYVGFRFNDWLLFNSEIEFEHAIIGDGEPGEVAVEFGYVEAQLHSAVNLRAGMMLVPVGIINELHEPPTFHGALRPETERKIIPTTWRANGVGLVGQIPNGIGYKIYVIESLNAAKFSSGGIRSGRQNGAEAIAEDLAVAGRVTYTGVPGFEIGGSFFVGKTAQTLVDSTAPEIGAEIDAPLSLFSVHAIFARHGLELRGLFAQSKLNDVEQLNDALGFTGTNSIGDEQRGYYVTLAYDVLPLLAPNTSHYLAPFVQYEELNTQASVPTGFSKNPESDVRNVTLGLTYKPHPNVAFKFDYINHHNKADTAVDQFNLAVNYLF